MLNPEERVIDDFSLKKLVTEWDEWITAIRKRPDIRDITRCAWQRCRKLGITPTELNFKFLTSKELVQKRALNHDLREFIGPYMEQLSLSMYGISHVITLADKDGWIIELKGDTETLGGRKTGMVIGSSWAEKHIGNNGIGTALITEKPVFIYGVEHYGLPYRDLASLGYPLKDNDGELIGALSISVITRYVNPGQIGLMLTCIKVIERLNACNEQVNMLKELFATIIHDVKNPLTIVGAISQLGEKHSRYQKEKSYFKRIREQVIEATDTVNDLLMLNKPHHMKKLECPSEIIKSLLAELTPICRKNGINIYFKGCDKVQIPLERSLFRRVIYNLLINSINVMNGDGNITIEISDNDNKVIIAIRDDGPGIPLEFKKSIFNPYVSQRKGGTGIGLYIVYKVIKEIHNGDIWFESKAGVGTTFFIKLPKN